jgi:hypothetical protein
MTREECAEAARVVIVSFLEKLEPELTVREVLDALNKCAIELRTLN